MDNVWGYLIVIALCLLSYRVKVIGDTLQEAYLERNRTEVAVRECNLPCKCKHLLNLGTWEWAECMGVGRK